MGVGHVPEDPLHPEGAGADVQGRQRGGAAAGRALTAAHARGRFGEDEAARWYRRAGYQVLDRNWRCAQGEIDLVLGAAGVVVICEVKARAGDGFGGPQAAVDWRKQRRLRRLGALWLAAHPHHGVVAIRFDVAVVVGAKIDVLIDAF